MLPNKQLAVIEDGYIGVLGVTHISFVLFNFFEGSRVVNNNNKTVAKSGLDQWLGCDHLNLARGNDIELEKRKAIYAMWT